MASESYGTSAGWVGPWLWMSATSRVKGVGSQRAWTLQEIGKHPIIGGVTIDNTMVYEMMPFKFREQLLSLEKIAQRVSEQTDVVCNIVAHAGANFDETQRQNRRASISSAPRHHTRIRRGTVGRGCLDCLGECNFTRLQGTNAFPISRTWKWKRNMETSWDQVMKGSLPRHDPKLLHDAVTWNQETDTNSYQALFIKSALVRGLDREGKGGTPRRGEFVVKRPVYWKRS